MSLVRTRLTSDHFSLSQQILTCLLQQTIFFLSPFSPICWRTHTTLSLSHTHVHTLTHAHTYTPRTSIKWHMVSSTVVVVAITKLCGQFIYVDWRKNLTQEPNIVLLRQLCCECSRISSCNKTFLANSETIEVSNVIYGS